MKTKIKTKSNIKNTNNQNFLMYLAGFLVIGLSLFSYFIYNSPSQNKQDKLSLDDVNSIETNLKDTKLDSLDSDLPQIEKELK